MSTSGLSALARLAAGGAALLVLGSTAPVAHARDVPPPPVVTAQNAHADLGFDGLLHSTSDLAVKVVGNPELRISLPLRRVADGDPDHWQVMTHERISLTDTGEPVPFTTERSGEDELVVVARPPRAGDRVLSLRWDTRGAAGATRVTWLLPRTPGAGGTADVQASLAGPGPVRDVSCTTQPLSASPAPCDEVRNQNQSSAFGRARTGPGGELGLTVDFPEGALNRDTRQLVERLTWRTWWARWWPGIATAVAALGGGVWWLSRRRAAGRPDALSDTDRLPDRPEPG